MFKLRKRKRSLLSLKAKIILTVILFAVFIILVIYSFVSFSSKVEALRQASEYRSKVKTEEQNKKYYKIEDVYKQNDDKEENPSGGTSGLNLLLINDIKTEGFVKEYLEIAKQSEEGKLDDLAVHATVSHILGTQIAEGNTILNGTLPLTFLPVSGDQTPYWGKDNPYGVPADKFNLKNANMAFYTDGGGSVPTSDIPRQNSMGTFYGPFQQTPSYFGLQGGSKYQAAKINPSGTSDGRPSDAFYFPDQVVGLSTEMSAALSNYPTANFTSEQVSMLTSAWHNAGSGATAYQMAFGINAKNSSLIGNPYGDDGAKSLGLIFNDITNSYNKHKSALTRTVSDHLWKFIGFIALLEEGWTVDPGRNYDYVTTSNARNLRLACQILYPNKSDDEADIYVKDLIAKQTKSLDLSSSSAYGRSGGPAYFGGVSPVIHNVREETTREYVGSNGKEIPIVNEMPMETAGHLFASAYAGNYMYGTMLKYAGVGIDPTNPDDFLNNISDSEWKPGQGGIKDQVKQMGYELNGLTANREKLLDYALQFIGNPYCFGGDGRTMDNPVESKSYIQQLQSQYGNDSSNGYNVIDPFTKHKGMRLFDCSSFTASMYKEALGITLPRTSGAQINATNTSVINVANAKPGDLGGNNAHIVFFVANTPKGVLVLDQAMPGIDISLRIESNPNQYTWVTVNGVD